ncbi:Fc receptor-like protein 6 isoform X3 [Equus asinus]|uniref:Fc receptor-like protein 6 isoform X3 n=1 Tax=Equus asinus TaxID=9793 RepID=UPI0038F7415C
MLLWTVVLFFVPCLGKIVWLNLRAWPDPVFEGDTLTLQCQGRRNAAVSRVTFYKDGKSLQFSKDSQTLSVGPATVKNSGRYWCSGQVTYGPFTDMQISRITMVQVQELFLPPVLSTVPSSDPREGSPVTLRCETMLHPQRSALRLLFSFYKEGHVLQDGGLHPELCIPGAQDGDSGLYWCKAAPEGGRVQKQSPQLEIRVRVMSKQHAGNYSCQAENSVSKESSGPETLSVDGPLVLSTPTSSNWLVPWLPASLLGVMVIAAALLGYFRPWRKNGPLPPQNLPPAPSGEQHSLCAKVHYQNKKEEGVIYSAVRTTSNSEARPAESTSREKDNSVIYTEVRCPQLGEVPAKRLNMRSRTHRDPLGDRDEVLYW